MKFSVQQNSSAKVGSEQNIRNSQNSNQISRKSSISNLSRVVPAAEVSLTQQSAIRAERGENIRSVEEASALANILGGSILSSESEALAAQGRLNPGKVLRLVDSQYIQ